MNNMVAPLIQLISKFFLHDLNQTGYHMPLQYFHIEQSHMLFLYIPDFSSMYPLNSLYLLYLLYTNQQLHLMLKKLLSLNKVPHSNKNLKELHFHFPLPMVLMLEISFCLSLTFICIYISL